MMPGLVVRSDIGIAGLMQISASLGPNNSGSAVFDGSGRFIGVTLSKQEPLRDIPDREAMFGKGNFVIRADALQSILPKSVARKKTAKAVGNFVKTPSVEELYESLLPKVVTIQVVN